MNSVLGQNYANLEYVVIDGGSTDGSVDIIRRHAGKLAYWISEPDGGHGEALNKGFARTTGDIMAWINSDDMYLPWTFQVVSEVFDAFPSVSWISGFNAWWSSSGFLTRAERTPKGIHDYLRGNYGWIQQESVFWRRSLWDAAGGHIDEKMRLMVDGELWSRFFLHSDLVTVDCLLAGYRIHADNRAHKHYLACHDEMRGIVARLRDRCPPNVRSISRRLSVLQLPGRIALDKLLRLDPVYRNLFPRFWRSLAHRNLHFEGGAWKMRRIPFSLFPQPTL